MRVDGKKPEGPDADWAHLPDPVADAIKGLADRVNELEHELAEQTGRKPGGAEVKPLRRRGGPGLRRRVSGAVRRASAADAEAIGRLLHDFQVEYDEPTPGPEALAERIGELLAAGDMKALLAGDGPDGIAMLRFRPSLYSKNLECYLAELYVVPGKRGQGLGRALMEAVFELARAEGADYMDLNTSEDDVAARGLYESLGFTNREGKPDGPIMYYYEREL